jgi:hypothetical protein
VPKLTRSLPIGVAPILLATAIAGGSGYVVNAIVPVFRSPAEYADFSVLWSALYLIIAALSGVQQEVTRATGRRLIADTNAPASPVRSFAFVVSGITGIVILLSGVWWLPAVVGGNGWALAVPLGVGAASYIVVAVLSGTMNGLELWTAVGLMIGVDGVLRLVGVGIALALGAGTVGLFWAVIIPFPLTPLILWFFVRSRIVGKTELDVARGRLTWNVLRTIIASAATGVLISGFPLLLAATSPHATKEQLAAVNLSINLIRAPLVIVVLSLQSYLVVRFRKSVSTAFAQFLRLATLIACVTVVLSAVAWVLGPIALAWFGHEYALDGWTIAALVGASGLLGILCVSGPLALGLSHHGVYVAGWAVAALASVLVLLVPGALVPRMLVSLAVGPAFGVIVHTVGVTVMTRRRHARGASPVSSV